MKLLKIVDSKTHNKNERDWYLTIAEKRNVIELPITIEGFLIEKMAGLEIKIPKNPPKLSIDEFDDVFRNILLNNTIQPVRSA